MLRRLGIMLSVTALLLVFPALLAFADTDPSQNATTPTPVPLTPQPTFSPTPAPPSPFPTVQGQPTPFPVTQIPVMPDPQDTPPADLAPVLRPGQQISGVLPAGQTMGPRYNFTGRAGQVVVIRLTSPQVPTPSVFLSTEAGYSIRDASSGGNQETVFVHTLPETGSYDIQITSHAESLHDIEYTLYLDILTSQAVTYGDRIEDRMSSEAPARLFTFQGKAGDIVRISLEAWRFASHLVLEHADADGNYRELASGFNAIHTRFGGVKQIGPLAIPEDGEYRIIIARSLGTETAPGAYTLTLTNPEPVHLAYGETIDAELTPADSALYFRFEGDYGDLIDIQIYAEENADTLLNLYGGTDWRHIARDDDSGRGLDPEILGYLLNQHGTYIIEVRPSVAGDSIPFTLSLARNPRNLLDESPQRVKYGEGTLSFTGHAGETVRLVIEVLQGVNTPVVTVAQQDQTLLELGATSTERLAVDFVVPDDGPVIVQLTGGGYADSTVAMSIERLTLE